MYASREFHDISLLFELGGELYPHLEKIESGCNGANLSLMIASSNPFKGMVGMISMAKNPIPILSTPKMVLQDAMVQYFPLLA